MELSFIVILTDWLTRNSHDLQSCEQEVCQPPSKRLREIKTFASAQVFRNYIIKQQVHYWFSNRGAACIQCWLQAQWSTEWLKSSLQLQPKQSWAKILMNLPGLSHSDGLAWGRCRTCARRLTPARRYSKSGVPYLLYIYLIQTNVNISGGSLVV